MNKADFQIFEIAGCGRVIADLSRDDLPPVIQFEDGHYCFGLPRTTAEVSPLGYESIAEGNFIHECLHLFTAYRCGFVDQSVLYRASTNADFNDRAIWNDALREERIVLGLQVAVNDAEGDSMSTNKVGGFVLHLVAAAREYAEIKLREYGCELEQMKSDFLNLLAESGCLHRAFRRVPELVVNPQLGEVKQSWRDDAAGYFGDLAEAYQ